MSDPIVVTDARYAKGMMAVRCPSPTGFTTRAARLADALSRARFSHRECAYIMSPATAWKLLKLYADGWDANSFSGELRPPAASEEQVR